MEIHQRLFLLLFVCTIQLTISSVVVGQAITIDGITGIEFDTTGGDYSISITDDFSVFGISMAPQSLTFTYTNSEELFEIDGTVETSFDGETISATLDFSVSNEALESVELDVSTSFSLKSLTMEPTDLGFEWTGGTNFGIFGDVTATLDANEMAVSMGDSDDPGILIENGTITSFVTSVSGEFDVKTITIAPDDLTFLYSSEDDQFEMYGSATTTVDENDITISLGDSDDPGLILDSGSLTHINFGVTADFDMKGITISPTDLTFQYDETEDYYEFFGDVSVKFDGEEIDASLGDSDDPGIVYDNGSITHVNFGLTADFEIKSLTISPSDLTFQYDASGEYFEMFGDVRVKFDGDEIDATLGDSDNPGLVFDSGSITHVNFSLTGDFSVKSLTISPDSLTFEYDATEDYFEMYGAATTSVDGNALNLNVGDADDPGLILDNGTLTHLNFGITADFEMKGITISPTDLTFQYDLTEDYYEFYGEVSIQLDGNDIDANLGDADDPGIVFSSGTITHVNFGITANFDVKTITIAPSDLTFGYDSGEDYFEMYGSATTSVDGNDIELSFGDADDPGLIQESGTLTHINFGITADFDMKGITISPTDLTFQYDETEDYYEFFGDVSVKFDGEEIDASLGDSDNPGIVFDSGTITHVNFTLTGDITVKDLSIIPTDLTFEYDSGNDYFEMYGDIEFKIGDDEITSNMGDSDNPGLIYDNASITQINIGITEDFSVSGLKIKTTDLGVEWKSGNEFYLYGDANLSVDSETIDTDFGTSDDPGIVIKNGSLHSFEVDVNSDLTFGNLEVETVDLDIAYSDDVFEVTGEVKITEVFSLSVTLGDGDTPGLEIDVSGSEPSFKIEDLTIDIEHADLGTIDLKNFELAFNSSGITESGVNVVFPSGTEIDAILKFKGDPASIDEISITYTADNLEEALELFEGIQIAEMSGTVGNLTNTSDLYIDADLTTIFGGGFTLDSKSVTLLEMYDAVTIDADEFTMSGDVNVGAYESNDEWKSLLGSGTFNLDVIFQDYKESGSYTFWGTTYTYSISKKASVLAEIDVKIPSDPMVEAEASVYVNSDKDFDALVDVTFYVPSSIPFIGGDKLGSVDGAIRYKYNDLSDSYAAGWTDITVLWTKYYLGAKYKFSSRSVSIFTSSGTISDIKDDISDDENSKAFSALSPYIVSSHTFEVYDDPVAPTYLQFIADWGSEIDSVLVTVLGPEGVYEITRATLISKDDSAGLPTFGYEENMDWVTQDTGAVFIIHSPSAMSKEEIGHTTLIEGRYQVLLSIPRSQAPDSVSLDVTAIYQSPIIDLEVSDNGNDFELTANYWSSLPDSSHLSYYVNGVLIAHVEAKNFDEYGYGSETYTYSPDVISEKDTLTFYAVIDDGINPPEITDIITDIIYEPDFYGTISFPNESDSLKSGLRVFVDEDVDGSFDIASTGGLELFSITGTDGQFAINGLEEGTYEIRIVLPPGYRFVGGVDRKTHTSITFDGTPIELDLEIEAYTEAE